MNYLTFRNESDQSLLGYVEACIDDQPLSERVEEFERSSGYSDPAGGYAGIYPDGFAEETLGNLVAFCLNDPLFPRDGSGGVVFLGCGCGEWGCWPLIGKVIVTGTVVTWTAFKQPYRTNRDYSALGPFHFDLESYAQMINSVVPTKKVRRGV
jgi:hypothetical protein